MERTPIHGRKLGVALCEALGLDPMSVTRIVLDCDIQRAATVTVYGFAIVESADAFGKQVKQTLAEYELRPRDEPTEVTVLGDENKRYIDASDAARVIPSVADLT